MQMAVVGVQITAIACQVLEPYTVEPPVSGHQWDLQLVDTSGTSS